MSDFTAVRAVSLTLKDLLKDHITNSTEPQLSGVGILLKSPKEMRESGSTGVSLWLYRVMRNEHRYNSTPPRASLDQRPSRPLPVNLYYLVTPITEEPEGEQTLLGRVLQVFNDHAALRGGDLKDTLEGAGDELRLTLEALSLEELTRVWAALKEPYQLSVCYLVQLVTIDSDHEPVECHPVLVRESTHTQILEVV
jgi:hypothetical protein